jgi:pimeloyl-ACP methyl ester carboxylesterase
MLLPMLMVSGASAQTIKKITVPPPVNMERAELHVWPAGGTPSAVLILCPGYNGNGRDLLNDEKWREFAKAHRLTLAGLSFASNPELFRLGRGYYYANQGSGDALLACLKKAGADDAPVLLYGFSGGAHFAARFAEWQPERVLAWCAYSAAWWDEPIADHHAAPGIVACGADDERHQASLDYFQQGRKLGNRWTWVSLPATDHQPSVKLEQFARDYFSVLLKNRRSAGVWVDLKQKKILNSFLETNHESQVMWLPDADLVGRWFETSKQTTIPKKSGRPVLFP